MSTWTSIRDTTLQTLGVIAPGIATALGGPLAGQAVSVLSKTLLGHDKGTHDEVDAAIASATPEQLLLLKKADQDFAVQMKQIGVDVKRIAVDDRKNAREFNENSIVPGILTGVILLVFGAEAYVVFAGQANGIKDTNIAIISTLVIRETLHYVHQAVTYWFGADDPVDVEQK